MSQLQLHITIPTVTCSMYRSIVFLNLVTQDKDTGNQMGNKAPSKPKKTNTGSTYKLLTPENLLKSPMHQERVKMSQRQLHITIPILSHALCAGLLFFKSSHSR